MSGASPVSDSKCLVCSSSVSDVRPSVFGVQGVDTKRSKASWQVWHARLGHVGWNHLKHLYKKGLVAGMELLGSEPQQQHVCEACLDGKMHQHPFPKAASRAQAPFTLIYLDLMGPVETPSAVGKNMYVLTLIDDCTRYAWVYFLKRKSHAEERIRRFFAYVQRQFDRGIWTMWSDRGGEFLSNPFSDWLD